MGTGLTIALIVGGYILVGYAIGKVFQKYTNIDQIVENDVTGTVTPGLINTIQMIIAITVWPVLLLVYFLVFAVTIVRMIKNH